MFIVGGGGDSWFSAYGGGVMFVLHQARQKK